MDGLVMSDAEAPHRKRLIRPLRGDRGLEALQRGSVTDAGNILENARAAIVIGVGNCSVCHSDYGALPPYLEMIARRRFSLVSLFWSNSRKSRFISDDKWRPSTELILAKALRPTVKLPCCAFRANEGSLWAFSLAMRFASRSAAAFVWYTRRPIFEPGPLTAQPPLTFTTRTARQSFGVLAMPENSMNLSSLRASAGYATASAVEPEASPSKVMSVRISGLPRPTHIGARTPGMKAASNSSRTAPSKRIQCRMSPLRVSMM